MTSSRSSSRTETFLFYLLACVAACIAFDNQSLWIDEAQTALKAIPPTLHGLWQALDSEHNSNMQLPFYMLWVWGWARVFGVSELAIRLANLPWFLLSIFAIHRSLRRYPDLRRATILVFCIHPFVWYYLNEARPYIMELSGALLTTGALFDALDSTEALPASWWWQLGAGFVILCGAGLLGVPWAIAVTIFLLFQPRVWTSLRAGIPALLICCPILFGLALYFLWTIKQNIAAGERAMNVASMVSVFYDQLGFAGLGPGRAALRPKTLANTGTVPLSPLKEFILPIALLAIPLAWALLAALWKRFGLRPARFQAVLLLAISPATLVFALGYIRHTRMLSRHLTPLFPFLLMAEGVAILLLWKNGRVLSRSAAVLIVVALLVSSLELRFAFRHSKDDYRSAAAVAIDDLSHGKTVWWVASAEAGAYYRVPLTSTGVPGAAQFVWGNTPSNVNPPPDMIFFSKPDLSDGAGIIAAFMAANHYQQAASWQNISLWQKPGSP
jgi:hypothetical protein